MRKKKSHFGRADEILFPEDVEWIESVEIKIPLNFQKQKSLPLDYDSSDAKTASILQPKKKNAAFDSLALSAHRPVSGVSGRPRERIDSVESIKTFRQRDSTKRRECSYCGGPIDVGDDYRITHLKRTYHALCFEYVLNPEDQRRRLPSIRR